jgi:hypothetical protein|eukprot:SAG25_NODE_241_length_11184_cov_4.090934_3_plen_160_part_00
MSPIVALSLPARRKSTEGFAVVVLRRLGVCPRKSGIACGGVHSRIGVVALVGRHLRHAVGAEHHAVQHSKRGNVSGAGLRRRRWIGRKGVGYLVRFFLIPDSALFRGGIYTPPWTVVGSLGSFTTPPDAGKYSPKLDQQPCPFRTTNKAQPAATPPSRG